MPIQLQYVATVLKAPKGWLSDIEECQRNLHHKGPQPPVATKKGNHTHGRLHSIPLQLSRGNLPKILREYISVEGVNRTASSLFFSFFFFLKPRVTVRSNKLHTQGLRALGYGCMHLLKSD